MDYQRLIDEFVAMSRKILSPALTGIYLHGSLAMGCFNPLKSDIDLIVVLERGVTEKQKRDFMEQVVALNGRAPAKGLELSLVKREHCSPFVYPTPYELHFSPAHLRWFREDPDGYIQRMKRYRPGFGGAFYCHQPVWNCAVWRRNRQGIWRSAQRGLYGQHLVRYRKRGSGY